MVCKAALKNGDYDNPENGCLNCGRFRVMKGDDKKHRCEKCGWCIEDDQYDADFTESMNNLTRLDNRIGRGVEYPYRCSSCNGIFSLDEMKYTTKNPIAICPSCLPRVQAIFSKYISNYSTQDAIDAAKSKEWFSTR